MVREGIPMRDLILDALLANGHQSYLSGEALSRSLGVSRAAVSKHVMALRMEGHIIESVPRCGYRLISRADPWAGSHIQEGLHTAILGQKKWLWLKETGSTNQVAVLEALNGAEEGTVVVARRQSEGRGSKGHRWVDLPGSLLFSVLARPNITPENLHALPMMAVEAMARAVKKACGIELEQRLPNDLFLNNKKIAGVLVETLFRNTDLWWAVIGIGVNANVPSEAIPPELSGIASSLYAETGTAFSVTSLLKHILEELEPALYTS